MLASLGGNEETVSAVKESIGKTIVKMSLTDDSYFRITCFRITFEDGSVLVLWDDGQSCCERRYMHTDDKLEEFLGAKFIGAEIKSAPAIPYEDGYHEVQFLDMKTDKGVFQMASHNEHNGYYGGFYIKARLE